MHYILYNIYIIIQAAGGGQEFGQSRQRLRTTPRYRADSLKQPWVRVHPDPWLLQRFCTVTRRSAQSLARLPKLLPPPMPPNDFRGVGKIKELLHPNMNLFF